MSEKRFLEIEELYNFLAQQAVSASQPFSPRSVIGKNGITDEEFVQFMVKSGQKYNRRKAQGKKPHKPKE